MVNRKISHRPTICYRPIQPSDLEVLERLHADIFPIRYEEEFFQNVVHARDIVSWAAVDRSRPNGHSDELIGFVTARIVLAKETEQGLLFVKSLNMLQVFQHVMQFTCM
ncbi:hypothetical protein NC652_041056 [Populus alba x Populus x berolinensis]|nr:hypothetical protein NC652_041056 [Populus alba x Populus x berolinensis]